VKLQNGCTSQPKSVPCPAYTPLLQTAKIVTEVASIAVAMPSGIIGRIFEVTNLMVDLTAKFFFIIVHFLFIDETEG